MPDEQVTDPGRKRTCGGEPPSGETAGTRAVRPPKRMTGRDSEKALCWGRDAAMRAELLS